MELTDLRISPHLHPEVALLLGTLMDNSNEWYWELGELPPQGVTWQPAPNGHSIGAVLFHMAAVEAMWIEQIGLGRPVDEELRRECLCEGTDPENGVWPAVTNGSLAYYHDLLRRVRERTIEALSEYGDLETRVTTPWGMTVTKRWILSHVIGHDSYHGGQVALLASFWRAHG